MDKKEDSVLLRSGALPDPARSRVVVGAKQLKKALHSGADDYLAKPFGTMELISRIKALLRRTAKEIYLALDADPAVTASLAALCEQCGIAPRWVPSKAILGRACGIDVGAAAAAVVE